MHDEELMLMMIDEADDEALDNEQPGSAFRYLKGSRVQLHRAGPQSLCRRPFAALVVVHDVPHTHIHRWSIPFEVDHWHPQLCTYVGGSTLILA
jgi:hypothetical protein